MAALLTKIVAGAVGIGVGAAVITAVIDSPAEATPGGSVEASIVKIVDGDTVDVNYGNSTHRVRLLNVDAPESKNPNQPVECLGQAASDFLAGQLPIGSDVTLHFDQDLLDRYGRELAGVVKDDVLVNAEIARAGLGVPAYFAPNDLFLEEVESAHSEAKSAGVGLYDLEAECSIPAQAAQLESAAQQLSESVPAEDASAAVITAYVAELEKHQGEAAALLLLLGGDAKAVPLAGYTSAELADLTSTVKGHETTWAKEQRALAPKHEEAVEREAEEKAAKEAEEKRKAEEQAANEKRAAEEQAAREAAEKRAAEDARRTPPPAPQPPAYAPPAVPAPPPAANPGAGYTGCRAYIGGPYIDDKGRRYTPIDCKTKQPLVP